MSGGPGGVGSLYKRGDLWWASYQKDGKRVQVSTGTTSESEARKVLAELVAQVASGTYVARRAAPDFETVWMLLLDDYRANHQRERELHFRYKHLVNFFGGVNAANIDQYMVMKYRHVRQDQGAAAATINREMSALARALKLAAKVNLLKSAPQLSKLREDNVRRNWLSEDDFERLLAQLPEYLKRLAQVGFITGWRVSELLSRQWKHLDFAERTLRLEVGESKNREARVFSLAHEGLRAVLIEQRAWVNEIELRLGVIVPWVFCHRDGTRIVDYYTAWRSACERAGLKGSHFHDFRRVAARNLEASTRRSVAMAMLGHKTEDIFRRYAVVDENDIHEAARELEEYQVRAKEARRKEREYGKVLPLVKRSNSL
jgi:integrase